MNDLIKAAAELKPQAKTWLTLTNIRLALDLLFDTIFAVIRLAIVIFAISIAYISIPWQAVYDGLQGQQNPTKQLRK